MVSAPEVDVLFTPTLDPNAFLTRADQVADKLDDTIHSVVDTFKGAKSLYTENSDAIHATLETFAGDSVAGKLVDGWLGITDRVISGLDQLAKSQPFPFIGPVMLIFSAVVKLEVKRRENSGRARALILQMADMLSAILRLHFVRDPELKDTDGRSIQGSIQDLMEDVKTDIQDCGNLIDTYHKHSFTSKFFFSTAYAVQFKEKAGRLVTRKSDIIFAIQIHNTVNIDAIRSEVTSNNVMLKELLKIVSYKSDRQIQNEQALNDLGGKEKVLGNEEMLTSMASMIQGRVMKDGNTVQTMTVASQIAPGALQHPLSQDNGILSPRERQELRLPLGTILEQNAMYFSKKLDAQVQVISDQLEKVQQSTDQILRAVTCGPHEFIVHPDIRQIWKEMGWRMSVEARVFVMALHDHYRDIFDGFSEPLTPNSANKLPRAVNSTCSPTNGDAHTSEDPLTGHPLDGALYESDKWCLEFLNFRYLPSIMEAFDDDGSGFVRINEVNKFTASAPKGWSLLLWIAYWARGWRIEASIYAQMIHALLSQMHELTNTVHPSNSRIIHFYFRGRWAPELDRLVKCAMYKTWTTTSTPLDDLIKAQMEEKEKRLSLALNKIYFDIDGAESLELVKDSGRIEKDLFPILYLTLLRHASMIKLAKTVVLDDREFIDASITVNHIFDAIRIHLNDLEESWRGQDISAPSAITRYADGVYKFLYQQKIPDDLGGIVNDDYVETMTAVLKKSSIDVEELRFGPWDLDTSGYEKGPEPEHDSDKLEAAFSPILSEKPVHLPGPVYVGPVTDPVVDRIILRLEQRAATEDFRFAKSAISMLKSIANAEFERWTWSPIPRTLIAQMADVLQTLLQLRHASDLDVVAESGVTVIDRVKDVMRRIEIDFKDCGRLIRSYHRNKATEEQMGLYFRQRAEGLVRRKNDFIAAVSIPQMKGIEHFRAVSRTVIRQIREKRHRLRREFYSKRRADRLEYVSLVAKQLHSAETRALWHVNVSLSAEEEQRLADLSADLSTADWTYYQSLAKMRHRRTRAHIDLACYICGKVSFTGDAYKCVSCNNVVFCEECEQTNPSGILDPTGKSHLISHPLLRMSRPVVQVSKAELAGIARMYERLAHGTDDGDGLSDSDVQWSGEETDPEPKDINHPSWTFSEIEKLPQSRAPFRSRESSSIVESPVSLTHHHMWEFANIKVKLGQAVDRHNSRRTHGHGKYKFKCLHCHKSYTGVRFVMIKEHRGKHLCLECEQELSARYEDKPLPAHLLLLLKCTLPEPEGPASTVAPSAPVHPCFEEKRIQALEERLDLLLTLLNGRNGYARLQMPRGDNE